MKSSTAKEWKRGKTGAATKVSIKKDSKTVQAVINGMISLVIQVIGWRIRLLEWGLTAGLMDGSMMVNG